MLAGLSATGRSRRATPAAHRESIRPGRGCACAHSIGAIRSTAGAFGSRLGSMGASAAAVVAVLALLAPSSSRTSAEHVIAHVHAPVAVLAAPAGRTLARLGAMTAFGSPRTLSVLARSGRWLEVTTDGLSSRYGWVDADAAGLTFSSTPLSITVSLRTKTLELRSGNAPCAASPSASAPPTRPRRPAGSRSPTNSRALPTAPSTAAASWPSQPARRTYLPAGAAATRSRSTEQTTSRRSATPSRPAASTHATPICATCWNTFRSERPSPSAPRPLRTLERKAHGTIVDRRANARRISRCRYLRVNDLWRDRALVRDGDA